MTQHTDRHDSADAAVPVGPDARLAEHGLRLQVIEPIARPESGGDPDWRDHPALSHHVRAAEKGFYEKVPTGAVLDQVLGCHADDGRRSLGVYEDGDNPADTEPVGTFVDFSSTMTASPGRQVPVWQVTNVTVSPGHRRRGVLRAMMTRSLADAAASGHPVAALTATEATIYGRFGFGVAARRSWIRVDTRGRVDLAGPTPSGRVRRQDPRELGETYRELQESVRRQTPGSTYRTAECLVRWQDRERSENEGKGTGLLAAVHRDERGQVRGAALYRFEGWQTEPTTITVEGLVAQTSDAWRGLVEYLMNLDLIERVQHQRHPDDGLLAATLADPRRVQTVQHRDDLYVRVLDVAAAFEGRDYAPRVNDALVLHVRDGLGHAAGTWRLSVDGGRGRVDRLDAAQADVSLDVRELGALWLGGTSARTLARAGLLDDASEQTTDRLDAMLAPARPVHLLTGF